jgi:hypothetical protein
MKIAVIGGGIFGVTIASNLAKNHTVDLFEKNDDILQSASGINQYRIHRGYHYPRSSETATNVLKAEPFFKNEFAASIVSNVEHYYCISNEKSLTDANQYIDFCKKHNLKYSTTSLDILNKNVIDICVNVKEDLFDPLKLKEICWQKLNESHVNVYLKSEVSDEIISKYDFTIVCTYAKLNNFLKNYPALQTDFQFELCEKPVVKLPNSFSGKSIVIMDGPFMCVDPYGCSDLFVLGNVVHAIHSRNIGKFAVFDKKFLPFLDKGIIKNPPITNFKLFIESAKKFMPEIQDAEHIGSMFTIRMVPFNVENTDERPTIVRKITKNLITVFSGKIPTCLTASKDVSDMIESKSL